MEERRDEVEEQRADWCDQMMRAQDAEEGAEYVWRYIYPDMIHMQLVRIEL